MRARSARIALLAAVVVVGVLRDAGARCAVAEGNGGLAARLIVDVMRHVEVLIGIVDDVVSEVVRLGRLGSAGIVGLGETVEGIVNVGGLVAVGVVGELARLGRQHGDVKADCSGFECTVGVEGEAGQAAYQGLSPSG